MAHPHQGMDTLMKQGCFFLNKVQLLDGLTLEVLLVKPITPGIILHWLEGSNKEMESQQSVVFDLLNYSDSGMHIENPRKLILHEFGYLNM